MFSAAGRITRFSRDPGDVAKAHRLAGRALLPGLVNGHSHAFQRVIRGRTEHRTSGRHDSFWTWRESMYRAANRLTPEAMYHTARMAFLEMALSGITTVGEFHYVHHAPGGEAYADRNLLALQVVRAAREVGLRIALLRTVYVRAGWNKPPDPLQVRFLTPRAGDFIADTEALRSALAHSYPADRAWTGIAPHSLRAVPLEYLRESIRYARVNNLPVHMHVAEQPAEVEACRAEYGRRPVELLDQHGLLDSRFTDIHAIHISGDEIGQLARSQAAVCACPTTERNLGDGILPADRLLNAGVRIALGSDSNVQINLFEDARSLEYHLRMHHLRRAVLAADNSDEPLPHRLLDCATRFGAESLGAPGGVLEIGRPADFFTVNLNDPSIAGATPESLLTHIVFSLERAAIRDVCVGGEFVVQDGRHAREEKIIREFGALESR